MPLKKAITYIIEVKAKDDKLYVSAIFDCYELVVLELSINTNMKASLCANNIESAYKLIQILKDGLSSYIGFHYTRQ